MKNLAFLLTLLTSFSCDYDSGESANITSERVELPKKLVSKVVKITDGDTIALRFVFEGEKARQYKGKNLRIRFAHIDTPERGRDYYQVAKKFVIDACAGKEVTIIHDGEFDRYGRLIGEVILPDGRNLNKLEVANGLALHYKKYSNVEDYARLEEEAKKKGLEIWSLPRITTAYPNFYERKDRQ
jgi:micrococcal nuclease